MRHQRTLPLFLASLSVLSLLLGTPRRAVAWGDHGHTLTGRAAATNLPAELPKFFRDSAAQLAYLNPEPDRWRVESLREMWEAFRYDHYLDIEAAPQIATSTQYQDRFEYLAALHQAKVQEPERTVGLLQYSILELHQRLLTEFRLWRRSQPGSANRKFIEQRIINDAGILGHYVADGANPHHTTVHNNGWAEGFPNPKNFKPAPGFHSRFESEYVRTHIKLGDLLPHIKPNPSAFNNPRADIIQYLRDSNGQVERLYELDQKESFGQATQSAAHKKFTVERLVAGVEALRSFWLSAWRQSA